MSETPHVGLFVTCLVDLYRPNVGFAAIELLEKSGAKVSVPESQTCCGQPAYNSGDQRNTREIAMRTIEAFESFDYIVAPSGSCAGMLRDHYVGLFDDQHWKERAQGFSARCYELTSFLTEVMNYQSVHTKFAHTVTYHDSCSGLRELNIKDQPRKLMSQVDGLQLSEMQDTEVCCGFGGTFCVKFPDISERMVTDKAALIKQSGADVVLGGDMGCLLNISGRLQRLKQPTKVYHVAEILAGMSDVPAIGEKDNT